MVLFSETRAASGTVVLDGGHELYAFLDEYRFAGVGILIHSRLAQQICRVHHVS